MTTNVSWDRLRAMVQARDKETCVYCGAYAPDGHCDHILPLSKGGNDTLDNLAWSCSECNLSKGHKTLREWLDTLLKRVPKTDSQDQTDAEQELSPSRRQFIYCLTAKEARLEKKNNPHALVLHMLPDYRASGWDCDCGGYGYIDSYLGIPYVSYPERVSHGHHHPECVLLQYWRKFAGGIMFDCQPIAHYLRDGIVCTRWDWTGFGYTRGWCSLPFRDDNADWHRHLSEHFPGRSYIPTIGQYMKEKTIQWEKCKAKRMELLRFFGLEWSYEDEGGPRHFRRSPNTHYR